MNGAPEEPREDEAADEGEGRHAVPPIEDIFNFDENQVDFMSAESFPASDPPPPQSSERE